MSRPPGVNRIVISLVVICGLLIFWEFRVNTRRAPTYRAAVKDYQNRNYVRSLAELQTSDEFAPNNPSVLALMGWNSLKLDKDRAAEKYFSRASRFEPRSPDPLLGWIYAEITLEKFQKAERLLKKFKLRFGETASYQAAESVLEDQARKTTRGGGG
ncbi:MAG: tetratricopeptide repeat protein [Terriglobia bacterium]